MEVTEVIPSPVGSIEIAATRSGVSRVRLLRRRSTPAPCLDSPPCPDARRHLNKLRLQLRAYFEGKLVCFRVPLDLSGGTPFQRRVWHACARIPYGQVRTYGQLAAMAGHPRAARAVGQAMGANPIPIIIPCHRVIRSDGSLGGYGLGVRLKKQLLRLEGVS